MHFKANSLELDDAMKNIQQLQSYEVTHPTPYKPHGIFDPWSDPRIINNQESAKEPQHKVKQPLEGETRQPGLNEKYESKLKLEELYELIDDDLDWDALELTRNKLLNLLRENGFDVQDVDIEVVGEVPESGDEDHKDHL